DFPAEIRAPQGTLYGVSGFQLHFGSREIHTPGDEYDVLVAMNAAALKTNISFLKPGGTLILNKDGFDDKNIRLAKYDPSKNPMDDEKLLADFVVHKIAISQFTRNALENSGLSIKEIDRSKNMFALGFVYWLFNRKTDFTEEFLKKKFLHNPVVAESNIKVLKAGYNFGITVEATTPNINVRPARLEKGIYRNIRGNEAIALGIVSLAQKTRLDIFFAGYPITPASDILHDLARMRQFVYTFQAEDEIAAVTAAIGASFGGGLGITASSGPGIALKTEAIGLAVALEIPLIIINVQRAGPSTGMPTKTEQSDLLQAFYGRNGETPLPVMAAKSPSDCFNIIYEAGKVAIEHMTPVLVLSDGYLGNGSSPWKIPDPDGLPEIKISLADKSHIRDDKFLPYLRDEKLSRPWAVPGIPGFEHRIGGLSKEHETGNVSYDPDNNEKMVKIREQKVEKIAEYLPEQEIEAGDKSGKMLVMGWGSTYGASLSAVKELIQENIKGIGFTHLRYIKPFPRNLEKILSHYDYILIPELNNGQLIRIIREKYELKTIGMNKIKGLPFTKTEIKNEILKVIKEVIRET
ncbi:MAG: 2-oxoacid:acceptor oxidoreductase subunit alpha, partial [Cyclobacteriaceae bacterium]|nr:2-oxoacid:acceptor oxidoreductase subunit alpha [Cyclobacteriaceae bacterium]